MNDDLISRQAVDDAIYDYSRSCDVNYAQIMEYIDKIPSVNPQEPKILETLDFAINASNGDTNYFVGFRNGLRYSKSLIDGEEPQFERCAEQEPKTGHWIAIDEEPHEDYECDRCGYVCSTFTANIKPNEEYKFCPNCGCRMFEPQERSE